MPTSYHLITQQAGKVILQPEPKKLVGYQIFNYIFLTLTPKLFVIGSISFSNQTQMMLVHSSSPYKKTNQLYSLHIIKMQDNHISNYAYGIVHNAHLTIFPKE